MKEQGVTDNRLQLLREVTGAFRPGVLTALMGVSGAGKTTLMDVLAGRKTGGYIEGDVRISGFPKNQETFARISGYCEQTDIHSPQVTVRESVIYSAFLRLPREVSNEEKMVSTRKSAYYILYAPNQCFKSSCVRNSRYCNESSSNTIKVAILYIAKNHSLMQPMWLDCMCDGDIKNHDITVQIIVAGLYFMIHKVVELRCFLSLQKFVDEVMDLVELDNLSDAIVGLPGVTGLSTEQRKRLTIAVELIANPSIIFMDEPTSGLDARAAAIVMRTVRNTVDTGRTVVCTIHQPSIDIFEAFDEVPINL